MALVNTKEQVAKVEVESLLEPGQLLSRKAFHVVFNTFISQLIDANNELKL